MTHRLLSETCVTQHSVTSPTHLLPTPAYESTNACGSLVRVICYDNSSLVKRAASEWMSVNAREWQRVNDIRMLEQHKQMIQGTLSAVVRFHLSASIRYLSSENKNVAFLPVHADFHWNSPYHTRNSAIADKPRDAFKGQSRSPNMVPFHMLRMVSY